MNVLYAKTILYAFPHLEALAEQIDRLVEKKALGSMNDFSPALEQYEKIINLIEQKTVLFRLEILMEKVLKKFTQDELDCLDYKYFKRNKKEYFIGFDATSRNYFRKQIRIALKVAKAIESYGFTDQIFKEKCLSIEFFASLFKRVKEREQANDKTVK